MPRESNESNPLSASSAGRARRQGVIWILTIPVSAWSPPLSLTLPVVYVKGQREIGENGFEHWQLIAYFTPKQSLAAVKNCFCREAHGELTRSAAAEEYVWKDDTCVVGTRFELGTKPVKRNSAVDWERVWQCAIDGDLLGIPANVRVSSYNALRKIRADYARPVGMERSCCVLWGATGTGKSRRAWDEAGFDAYPKSPSSKFWDGYQGHAHVVIDEFRGEIGIGHLLRWLDRYPVLVEVKGSAVVLSCTRFWITSNLPPTAWYPDVDQLTYNALLRRLDVIEIT